MRDERKFKNLIEFLASEHPLVQHSKDNVHFASTLDEADNSYARMMRYPCVALDIGDMHISEVPNIERNIVIMFLDHVVDTGSAKDKDHAFDITNSIAIDFLSQLVKIAEKFPKQKFLSRVTLDGTDLVRVELEESGLYGWAVSFSHTFSLASAQCDNSFPKDLDTRLEDFFKSISTGVFGPSFSLTFD